MVSNRDNLPTVLAFSVQIVKSAGRAVGKPSVVAGEERLEQADVEGILDPFRLHSVRDRELIRGASYVLQYFEGPDVSRHELASSALGQLEILGRQVSEASLLEGQLAPVLV